MTACLKCGLARGSACDPACHPSDWGALPPELLGLICSKLAQHTARIDARLQRQTLWAVAGVCSTWRTAAFLCLAPSWRTHTPQTLSKTAIKGVHSRRAKARPRSLHHVFWHPLQMLTTQEPSVVPGSTASKQGAMVRCLVIRQRTSIGNTFTMYGNEELQDSPRCFMLCAVQVARLRPKYLLSLSHSNPHQHAVCQLQTHTWRNEHQLVMLQQPWLASWLENSGVHPTLLGYWPPAQADGRPGQCASSSQPSPCLASMRYTKYTQALGLPRKLEAVCAHPPPGHTLACSHGPCCSSCTHGALTPSPLSSPQPLALGSALGSGGPNPQVSSPTRSRLSAPALIDGMPQEATGTTAAQVLSGSPNVPMLRCLSGRTASWAGAAHGRTMSASSYSSSSSSSSAAVAWDATRTLSGPACRLQSKMPHWNETLHAYCLNFDGRVKLPSVRNFQLCVPDGSGVHDPSQVMLQFGKCKPDVFALDFRVDVLSPVQALAMCLPAFHSHW